VRLIDLVFRGGHLSERTLVDAVTSGDRPLHLDRCDICGDRAAELGRFLSRLEADGRDIADEMFAPERLAAQQGQIARRLEQLDSPVRVIAFPAGSRPDLAAGGGRRVAASWVGVAAAAGLAVGVSSGQLSARMSQPATPATSSASADTILPAEPVSDVDASVFAEPYDRIDVDSMQVLDDLTPRMMQISARSGG
jgi:hypothetical protein